MPASDEYHLRDNGDKSAPPRAPSVLLVHGALILVQCIFGGGSVVGKLGVAAFNPMVFALIREAVAGVLLLLWALYKDGPMRPRTRDAPIFFACGCFIFLNQSAFIVGDKLSDAVLASAWQPTQPVFTLLISIFLGWERATPGKAVGIALSFGGAAFMATWGQQISAKSTTWMGNVLFFVNCLGTALYVIVVKVAFRRGYPPSTVTAWSYLCGAIMMACVATGFSSNCALVHFVCPADASTNSSTFTCDEYETSCEPWAVPESAVLPLCYWIAFNSCVAYWLMTWGNKHAKAGFVLAYCALQPLVSMVLSAVIIAIVGQDNTHLVLPGWNALGGIGVVAGLVCIVVEGKRQHDADLRRGILHAAPQHDEEEEPRGHVSAAAPVQPEPR